MFSKKTISSVLIVFTFLMSTMTITAFAVNASFSGSLPAKHGDTEVSTASRASSDVSYFSIAITELGGNGDSARAWTEKTNGVNLSSPYNEATCGVSENISYSSIPGKGTLVVLNLDNPVYTTDTVPVSGSWNPN